MGLQSKSVKVGGWPTRVKRTAHRVGQRTDLKLSVHSQALTLTDCTAHGKEEVPNPLRRRGGAERQWSRSAGVGWFQLTTPLKSPLVQGGTLLSLHDAQHAAKITSAGAVGLQARCANP